MPLDSKKTAMSQGTNDCARHEAFSELYNLSHTRKEDFIVPEIAIVGGDLETRAAVVESLLGVRLNIGKFETSIATPLVIQSFNKPSCATTEIRVLNHGAGDFTPPLSLSFDSAVADAVLSTSPQNKAAKAVVIRSHSRTAPNLQLVLPVQALPTTADPQAADDATADVEGAVSNMVSVKKLAKQLSPQYFMVIAIVTPHDTAGSNFALEAALRADRSMSRTTLLVALRKADLAAIEATKTQAFNLLHADVLSSLPKGSTPSVAAVYLPPTSSQMSSGEAWAKALATGDETLQALGSRIAGLGRAPPAATGIINTRALLEKKFMGRQQSAAQGMLSMLQLRCDGARHCFEDAQRALEAMLDAGQLRRAHMATVSELLNCFSSLLSGKGCIDMHRHGLTSAEECDSLGEESWPLIAVVEELDENADSGEEGEEFVLPIGAGPTAEVPLYGVAAAQRCLEEFDSLLEHAGTFGSEAWQEARRLFDVHRIANMLLAQDDIGLRLTGNMHGHGRTFFGEVPPATHNFDSEHSFPEASPDAQRRVGYAMGRIAADQLLKPLVAALCARLRLILTRLPGLAMAEFEDRSGGFGASGAAAPPPKLSENFLKALEGKTCELVSSAQDHVQQQLATIIKHTHVSAPWPQVPAAMATGRLPGSSATSISDISSHHLIASGAMHAQAIGEALSDSGEESGDDGDLSGLAAAMGRLRGSSAQPSGTGGDVEEESEEEGEEHGAENEEGETTDEEEGSGEDEEEDQPAVSKPQAAALVHAPHAQVPESGEEEESDEEDAAEEPVSPQRQSPGKKSPKPSKSRKQEALLTTVRVSADTQSNSEKKSEANTKTTTQEQGQHAKGGASVPENGGGEDKSNHSVGKKGKDRKSSPKNAQQQEVEFEAPGVPEDKVEEVKMKKTSKSAPGNLAKGTQSKAKSQAGQAADAAAAEALAATTPPASTTGDSAVDSVSRKKKGKSLKGESDSQRDQVDKAVDDAQPSEPANGIAEGATEEPTKARKASFKKSSKSKASSPEPASSHAQQATDNAPFEVPGHADADEIAGARRKSSRGASKKSVRMGVAGSPELAPEALAAAVDEHAEVEAHGPAQRSSRHSVAASAPGSARGSAAHVVADAAAFGGNSEDEEKGNGSGSGEAERDAQAPEAGIEEAQVEEDSHRASSRRDDTKGFRRGESFREHPATHHPVYVGVMRHVGEMFDEIRASVTQYGISNCLRSSLLQPLSSHTLKQTAMTSMFSGSDSDILAQYASQDAMHAMRCDLELSAERQAALQKCKRLFDNVAAGDANAQAASIWSGVDTGGTGTGRHY